MAPWTSIWVASRSIVASACRSRPSARSRRAPIRASARSIACTWQRRKRRAQEPPGAVGAQVLEVVEALAAGQLGLGHRHHQLAARDPALARLDRRRPALAAELCVDQLDQPQPARHRPDHGEARVGRQALLVGAKLDPSDRLVTVTTGQVSLDGT